MIRVERLSRAYGDVRAVDDIGFTVDAGEVVGLLGPNGAGKTTALRMLATLLEPDSGTITIAGHRVDEAPQEVRARIGYQTGDTGLYERLTPREFLRYFGRLHRMDAGVLERRIEQLVIEFDLAEFAGRACGTLSTGQSQRVSLARTVLHEPPVLILDEPTSGLDIVSSQFILRTLRKAAADGRAVLFSTHIMSEVELICDRVIVLDRGRIVASGTLEDLLAETGEPQLSRAFLQLVGADTSAFLGFDSEEAT